MKESREEHRTDGSEALFEMANLFAETTGLPFVVWISSGTGSRHDIRVEVAHGRKVHPSQMVSVAIRPTVRVVQGKMSGSELALLKKWIDLNYDVLLKYWDEEIDTKQAIEAIRPIK